MCRAHFVGAPTVAGGLPAAVLLPVITALLLGLFQLGEKSLWYDEERSVFFAGNLETMWAALWNLGEVNMLAYYAVLHAWMSLLGDHELIVRAPSVAFALATVPVVYAIARRLTGARSAALAAILLALHPMFVQYAQEARAYALLLFLTSLSTLLVLRAVERPSLGRWIAYGVVAGLTLYVHLFGLFVVPAHVLLVVMRTRRVTHLAKAAAGFATCVLVALPGLVLFAFFREEQIVWLPDADARHVGVVLHALLGGGPAERPQLRGVALPAAYAAGLLMAAAAMVTSLIRRSEHASAFAFLLAWALMPVLIALTISVAYKPVFLDRYLIVCIPALAIVIAAAVSRLPATPFAAAAGVLVLFSAAALFPWFVQYEKEDWRSATSYLLAETSDGDAMAFYQPWAYTPVYYYADQFGRDGLPTHVGTYGATNVSSAAAFSAEWVRETAEHHSTMWLVLSHNQNFDGTDPQLAELIDRVESEYVLASRRTFAGSVDVRRYVNPEADG